MVDFAEFAQLDDEGFFTALVTEHFTKGWETLHGALGKIPVVDAERVKFAFNTYKNNVEEVAVRLDSKNPDHYKRAACLLDALNRAEVIQDWETNDEYLASLEDGTAFGLSYDDCQYRLKFIRNYCDLGNQMMAFDLAFRCCETYEDAPRPYTPNFFENIIHYLADHCQKNVGSLYMVLKAYWA